MFPTTRLRRLRRSAAVRDLFTETELTPSHLIAPLFIESGSNTVTPIQSMPGQNRYTPDIVAKEAKELWDRGIKAILLFGIPDQKDEQGSSAWRDDGVIQVALREIKEAVPDMFLITDMCFCEYTSHGHCGILKGHELDNDATLEITQKQTVSHAKAGADMIAPSGMIDGAVMAIRQALDEEGFQNVSIMSYSAKFASSFYGPFRDAAESAPSFGDRKTYQMNPANGREALREIELDIEEGADVVMVKPAMAYLDIVTKARELFHVPVAAYNVSGEYAMIKAAGANGWIDQNKVMVETLLSIRRAGADAIITYFAKEYAELYNA